MKILDSKWWNSLEDNGDFYWWKGEGELLEIVLSCSKESE